ncbi:NUDIX hydrolase [Alteribacter natronophilus]|uniref:NUDIX hydrolase n=1 Tax=Alteribacter natronophilus TaxID=2583810 RepID=UPI00110DF821|nr:NUDIX hydrolase [Alteribacter natronophilus]TMW71202.1 NUDIX hydrolase [Alteribacter natronophilus]
MEKWKTVKSTYLHKSPFGNIRKDQCELPDGAVIDEYYVNEYPDWVNAVVLTRENRIVLVEQYRHAGGDFYLEVPAGKKEDNETHEEGLIREVKEETGYVSSKEPILLGEFMVNPATQTNKVKTYLIVEAYKAYEQDLDVTEDVRIRLFDFESFGSLITTNQIRTQLFTAHAYYMARNYVLEKQINK